MNPRVLLLVLACWTARAHATVSIEFQLGALQWPDGATGVLIADTANNGFTPVASASGTVIEAGQPVGGSDDRIVAVFSISELTDWNGKRGFATLLEGIDYGALGVAAGQPIQFLGLPDREPGESIRVDEPFGEYRTDNSALLSGNMGFALPPDGGAYQLAVIDDQQGGAVDLAEFGTPLPDLVVELLPGQTLTNGSTLTFGSLYPGSTAAKTIRITNTGRAALTGLSISGSGPGVSSFDLQTLGISELAPQASATFSITFDPPTPGDLLAIVTIASNDIDDASFEIDLAGTALADPRLNKPFSDPSTNRATPAATNVSAWSDDLAGTYDGLNFDQSTGSLSGSLANLIVSRPAAGASTGGLASGGLVMNGRRAAIRGAFSTSGLLDLDLVQRDGSVVDVQLRLARVDSTNAAVIRGQITWNGKTVSVDLLKAVYHAKTNPAPGTMTGAYTLLLPSEPGWGTNQPGGDGWALVNINTGGAVSVSGALGDGTRFTEAATLSADHEFSIYGDLYRSTPERGRIGGRIILRNLIGVSDFDGLLQWRKFSDSRETRYPTGFNIEVWALGSRYTRNSLIPRVLTQLGDAYDNAELSLIGPSAPSPAVNGSLDRVLTWFANNRITHFGPERLSGLADVRNGRVSGSFLPPGTRTVVSFGGVAFQKQGLMGGVFANGSYSGAVRILPGNAFTFPGSEAAPTLARISIPGSPSPPPTTATVAYAAEATGLYQGILTDVSDQTGGALESVILGTGGALSGTLWLEGVRYGFKGTMAPNGTAAIAITPGTLNLILEKASATTDGFHLTGTLGTWTIDAQRRPVFTSTNRSPQEGRYTMAMRAPDGTNHTQQPAGDGYGALVVNYLGSCSGTLTLADGTNATLAGHVSRNAEWSFHRGLYGVTPRGYVAGKLTFRDVALISDLDGSCRWVRLGSTTAGALFPGGFDTVRSTIGCRYTSPGVGSRAFPGLDNATYNVWLRFAHSSIGAIEHAGTWSTANKVFIYGPETFSIAFNPATGILTGTYLDAKIPTAKISARFGAAILQKQSLATGFASSAGSYGFFGIEARDTN